MPHRQWRFKLGWCEVCHEHSVKVKTYRRAVDNARVRIWFCLNKGHGLIDTQVLEKGVADVQGTDKLCSEVS